MLFSLTKDEERIFNQVATAARLLDVQAWVVGGFVRDRLLGRPSKDLDIVCVGDGIQLAEKVADLLYPRPKVAVFARFGTAMIRSGDLEVEFVGARKESYRHDSRKPEVEPGTLEDDQNRRDFTINALAISLNKDDYGKISDPFNGLHDLQEGIIQTPLEPAQTFSDDPLRMMRAIRFATQLHFAIAEKTFTAIQQNAERIKIVSQERITDELNKIILSEKPSIGFDLLSKSGLLQMTRALALELAPHRINVNAIGPGRFWTAMTDRLFADPAVYDDNVSMIPLGRPGVAADLAGAAVLLASDAGDYITGQTIYVDGGWLAHGGVRQ